jgi:beta-lactam-binding protein with PASTA domain
MIAAGFPENAISVVPGRSTEAAGIVFDQQPIPGSEILTGDQAIIAVSEGP